MSKPSMVGEEGALRGHVGGSRLESSLQLPRASELPPSLVRYIDDRFRTQQDLAAIGGLKVELRNQCADLDASLSDLTSRLADRVEAYAVRSASVGRLLNGVREGLFAAQDSVSRPLTDGAGEITVGRNSEPILGKELPELAKEVARVEAVRAYAEVALKLDSFIGDVEDAVSSSTVGKLLTSTSIRLQDVRLSAISSLRKIEGILAKIAKERPKWTRLVLAVDNRVDRALAVLRPQAIADHRSLLASLGWPPPLSNFASSNPGNSVAVVNPLITMKGNLKELYFESFQALCQLQEFQRQRRSRQLDGQNLQTTLWQPLWAIEELVNPIFLASQRHFSKWLDKPEFIFALVYKATRDFVDSMDEILQPVIDKARLAGYSCREEWVAAIVTSLCLYLAREVFPVYNAQLLDESTSTVSPARIAWLNLIDSMISFDKRIQSLMTNTGLLTYVHEDGNLERVSSLSVFTDRPDWLEIWADLELKDALDKMKPDIENEKNWNSKIDKALLLSGSDSLKTPAVSNMVLHCLSSLIDRARPLPNVAMRLRFTELTLPAFMHKFLDILLQRCQEAEGLTALADDDAVTKVCNCINISRYCDSVLTEWCEDTFFLEMWEYLDGDRGDASSILEKDIKKLQEFIKLWLDKILSVILRGFDAHCRDYMKNKKQWQEREEGANIAKSLVEALDYLQTKVSKLHEDLNEVDFVCTWRDLAAGIDQLLFAGIVCSSAKFSDGGVERLQGDLQVLFAVFGSWCLRPECFFPQLSEGIKLLNMEERALKDLMDGKQRWLREKHLHHLTVADAEKILKSRVFIR